jgi:hypothetical protein
MRWHRTRARQSLEKPGPARFVSGNPAASQRVRVSKATVTEALDQQVREALQRRRRSRIVPIALIVFAVGASACAYLWVNHGDQVRTAVFAIPSATGSTVAASREQPVSRADFDAFERQMADTLRSMTVHLDAQQADLKRLADQVAALSAKVETTQGATSSIPAQTPVAPVATPAPPRPPTIVQRRKPAAPPKSTGPISTGGAPLPPDR